MTMSFRTYSELSKLQTFEERFDYLKLSGEVASDTFGFDRYINQQFYRSKEWKRIRDYVIVRDNGCNLGIPDNEIIGTIYIHHMNPLTVDDIEKSSDNLLNPEYLICVSMQTHNAIHYGTEDYKNKNKIVDRTSNDTCPWKR